MKMTLRAARINAGMTQEQAAKQVNVDVSTIAKWEKGKTYPTIDRFTVLCGAYGVAMDDIFLPSK